MSDARRESLSDDEDDGVVLDVLGILDGVDKASLRGHINCAWDYLRHYAHALQEYRDEPINILEIGVFAGASLNLWLRYFSRATIIGVDINQNCAVLSRGRAHVKIGSQDDRAFMTEIATSYPPTVIIDDGSHVPIHIVRSFEILFPLLSPGGMYIVEDLSFHFASNGAEITVAQLFPDFPGEPVFNYFSRLIAAKAAHVTALKDASDDMNEIYGGIDSICVVGGALLIKKKTPRDLSKYVAVFERELRMRAANGPSHYKDIARRYAEFLITYRHNVDRAVQLLEEFVPSEPDDWLARKLLHKGLLSLGRLEQANQVKAGLAVQNQDVSLPETFVPEWMVYPP